MHHSGQFFNIGGTYYVGENTNTSHIDFCHSNEMPMLEIISMANYNGVLNDCKSLFTLQNDNDVMDLTNFIDQNMMVGVLVKHEKENISPSESEFLGQSNQNLSSVDEPLQFVGDNQDNIKFNEGDLHADNTKLKDVVDDNGSNNSDDQQSVGSNSDMLENFVDSECDDFDDDILFDANIDYNNTHKGNQNTYEGHNMHKGYLIFIQRVDILDPKFELGMSVRHHSIKQEMDVVFTHNNKFKVQAKCKHDTYPWVSYASKVQNKETIQRDVKLFFNKSQLYRLKKIVSKMGSRRSNPSTTVKIKYIQVGGKPQFKWFYICWGTLKKGFLEGCRLIICLDGCHLKTQAGGILLNVVGIDANNFMCPFAYAVIENEKRKSWLWFVDLLFCVMHLHKNFKIAHKGLALKTIRWKAARASRVVDFDTIMAQLKEMDIVAFEWLVQRPPTAWSRSHFSTHPKSDILLNNISESFNALILRAKNRPIMTMLEIIRLILMKKIHVMRDQMGKYNNDLCPKIIKLLEKLTKNQDQFEIESYYGIKFKVHIGEKTCFCRRWELIGIPCYTPEEYIHDCYKKKIFMKTYSHLVGEMNDNDMCPNVDMQPLIHPKSNHNAMGCPLKKKNPHEGVMSSSLATRVKYPTKLKYNQKKKHQSWDHIILFWKINGIIFMLILQTFGIKGIVFC
ncbi:hypothetical protein Pfo_027447 [Paulownia fortunei]|nr:hypothetical protein Pfo_027447 [Paulownia fortunei]